MCTCPICCQLFPTHTLGDVADGDAGVQFCVIGRLGFVDAVAVTDGEDVGESFDLQVLVDLQCSAIGHVISCGDKGMDVITQNALLLSMIIQDVQFIPSEFSPHGVAMDSRGSRGFSPTHTFILIKFGHILMGNYGILTCSGRFRLCVFVCIRHWMWVCNERAHVCGCVY